MILKISKKFRNIIFTTGRVLSYARINGLIHNPQEPVIVHITFITEVPFIVTGEIVSLEEDMIEIKPFGPLIGNNEAFVISILFLSSEVSFSWVIGPYNINNSRN